MRTAVKRVYYIIHSPAEAQDGGDIQEGMLYLVWHQDVTKELDQPKNGRIDNNEDASYGLSGCPSPCVLPCCPSEGSTVLRTPRTLHGHHGLPVQGACNDKCLVI
jgi:hypothetical protein